MFETGTATGSFNLPSPHNHIPIAKYLFSNRDEQSKNLGDNAVLTCEMLFSSCGPRLKTTRAYKSSLCVWKPVLVLLRRLSLYLSPGQQSLFGLICSYKWYNTVSLSKPVNRSFALQVSVINCLTVFVYLRESFTDFTVVSLTGEKVFAYVGIL